MSMSARPTTRPRRARWPISTHGSMGHPTSSMPCSTCRRCRPSRVGCGSARTRPHESVTTRSAASSSIRSTTSSAEPGPKFVFAHVLLPHPPYTFASDGRFLTDEEDAALTKRRATHEQLTYLQARIEALVDRLLALPEAERPIIVLQADEGPYPTDYARNTVGYDWATATTEDLEVKFGIFNAMYLPGSEAPDVPADPELGEHLPVDLRRLLRRRPAAAPRPVVHVRGQIPAVRPHRDHGSPADGRTLPGRRWRPVRGRTARNG